MAIFEFPLYVAAIVVDPTASVDVVNVALPPLSWAVPNTDFPAVNVTGPVGRTVGDVIVAVNVTACPSVEGFGDEVSVAALVVCSTSWFKMAELLGGLFTSPE